MSMESQSRSRDNRSSAYKSRDDYADDRRHRDRRDTDCSYDRRHRDSRRYEKNRYENECRQRYKDNNSHRRSSRKRVPRSRSRSRSISNEPVRRRPSRSRHSRSVSRDRRHKRSASNESVKRYEKNILAHMNRSTSRSRSKSLEQDTNQRTSDIRNYEYSSSQMDRSYAQYCTATDDDDDGIDKKRIHQEMQERLAEHLAREGKVYPAPKPQASHPIFANDGSFLETFKKMQEQQQQQQETDTIIKLDNGRRIAQPLFGKRRGGKILKTGIVQKQKIIEESAMQQADNDAWALYLQEVKKYKNVSCDADAKTRPLVK